jgi:putative transcriptional regulator
MGANFTLDPNNLPTMTPEETARLDAMTEEDILAAAESDPDNPPLTEAELDGFHAARAAKRARQAAGMTQKAFADAFKIGHDRLRDIESARNKRSDTALLAYLAVIENDPEGVARVLAKRQAPGGRDQTFSGRPLKARAAVRDGMSPSAMPSGPAPRACLPAARQGCLRSPPSAGRPPP